MASSRDDSGISLEGRIGGGSELELAVVALVVLPGGGMADHLECGFDALVVRAVPAKPKVFAFADVNRNAGGWVMSLQTIEVLA